MAVTLEPEKTFRAPAYKALASLAGSLLLVVVSIFALRRDPLFAWMGIAFFGLGVVVFALQMHPSASYLTLGADGFTWCALFRRRFVPWSEVEEFAVVGTRKHRVGWRATGDHRRAGVSRMIANDLKCLDAGFPETYGMKPAELAAMMNERLRTTRAQSGFPSTNRF